jgi:hypothetical protein
MLSLPPEQIRPGEVPDQERRILPEKTRDHSCWIHQGLVMSTQRKRLEAKVQYLQSELEALKDYFYVPETYHYLIEELDAQQVLLKHLEVQEQFAAIDAGDPTA